jgi:type II secretory ATPase GspE/PulE/Tfp pilus assembly ATPase PilB-like protein
VAEIAIQAALTGHLVFSTLHTNDAPSAMTRLIDMGVKPFLVCAVGQAVMAQRLIRVLCPQCKKRIRSDRHRTAADRPRSGAVTGARTRLSCRMAATCSAPDTAAASASSS